MNQPWWKRALWSFCWLIWLPVFLGVFRARVRGQENIPKEGPLLLLANHVCLLDPPNVAWPCRRTVHFMATEQLFHGNRFVVWLMTNLNAFPKAKGVTDKRAMMNLLRRYKGGDIVVFFPEGVRSWAGRTLPPVPNTAAFLKRIQARVVYARVKTGHLFWPRWARYVRFVPLEIEYSPLYVYDDPDQSVEDIEADIERNLRVVPEAIDAAPFSFGFRMAEGVPEFLWACPGCFAVEGLSVDPRDRNAVCCRACAARWRVDVSQWLRATTENADDMRLVTAHDRVLAHFGERPVADTAAYDDRGVVLEDRADISRIAAEAQAPQPLGSGVARLTPDRIGVYDPQTGQPLWETPLEDVKAVLAQLKNLLHLRVGNDLFQLDPHGASRPKWIHFTEQHWRLARTPARRRRSPPPPLRGRDPRLVAWTNRPAGL